MPNQNHRQAQQNQNQRQSQANQNQREAQIERQNQIQRENQQNQNQRQIHQNQRQTHRTQDQDQSQYRALREEVLMCGDDLEDLDEEPCRNGSACWFFQRNRCKFSHEKDSKTDENKGKESLEGALKRLKDEEKNRKKEVDKIADDMEANSTTVRREVARIEFHVEELDANQTNIWRVQDLRRKLGTVKQSVTQLENKLHSKMTELEEVQGKVRRLEVLERRVGEVVRG